MRHKPFSLVVRLTLSISAIIIFVILSLGCYTERSIRHHFIEQDVGELNAVAQALRHSVLILPSYLTREQFREHLKQVGAAHNAIHFTIISESTQESLNSSDIDLKTLAKDSSPVKYITVNNVETWKKGNKTYRGAVVSGFFSEPKPVEGTTHYIPHVLRIIVAAENDEHMSFFDSFGFALRITTVIASLLSLLAVFIAVYHGHAPLRRMSKEIRSIDSHQLSKRIDTSTLSAELTELANSFNSMLDRLENSFERLSHFSGDIAHELRTPISNLKLQAEVALSKARTVDEYREVLYSDLEEYERMGKMVNDMLFLARADNNLLKPELIDIDLHDEVAFIFEFFEVLSEEKNITLEMNGEHGHILGDQLMIRRALSNIISNAIRYTQPYETIKVSIHSDAKETTLLIENPGPQIPAEHLDKIFTRFYRTDPSRNRTTEGSGLGLAISKSIIEAHQGTISVESSETSTIFKFSFPTA